MKSLTGIINLSFETWKIALVSPIFKSGDKSAPLKYRPISALPFISKICERHVHVYSYFSLVAPEFGIPVENQSTYLKNHSWVT